MARTVGCTSTAEYEYAANAKGLIYSPQRQVGTGQSLAWRSRIRIHGVVLAYARMYDALSSVTVHALRFTSQ